MSEDQLSSERTPMVLMMLSPEARAQAPAYANISLSFFLSFRLWRGGEPHLRASLPRPCWAVWSLHPSSFQKCWEFHYGTSLSLSLPPAYANIISTIGGPFRHTKAFKAASSTPALVKLSSAHVRISEGFLGGGLGREEFGLKDGPSIARGPL